MGLVLTSEHSQIAQFPQTHRSRKPYVATLTKAEPLLIIPIKKKNLISESFPSTILLTLLENNSDNILLYRSQIFKSLCSYSNPTTSSVYICTILHHNSTKGNV